MTGSARTASSPQVREIKGAQRRAWQEEWPFTVELLPLGWLFADDRYQRPRLDPFIEKVVLAFDPDLVGTIDVSHRRDNSYAILDGFQRSEVLRVVGKKAAWCTVYRGKSLREEAEFFFKKNRERRTMHPFYALRARRVAGDQDAEAIFKIVEASPFTLGGGGSRGTNVIVAISAVEEVYAMTSLHRDESLTPTLRTIAASFGEDREGATEGTILRGLGRVWQSFGDDEIDPDHLSDVLTAIGPRKLLGYALDRATTSRHSKAYLVGAETLKLYNKAMPRGRKLEEQFLQGKKS